MIKYLIGAAALLFLVFFSATIATYVFAGLLMFASIVAIVESIGWLKWIFARTGNAIDVMLFALGIVLTWKAGVTVAFSVAICGLLFSIYYKPMLVAWKIKKQNEKKTF